MNNNAPFAVDRDDRLAEVLDAYLAAQEAGTPPDVDEFLARYPELAGELRECLASLAFIRRAGNLSVAGVTPVEGESAGGVLGDFRILREVGRGGMGVVYEAEQISLRRRVALKVLPFAATMDPRHLQRFHNEAQAAACLHHTNIVPVYFVGCERGVHFYAMQFIDGQPLSDIIRQLCRLERQEPSAGEEHTVASRPSSDDAASTPPVAAITPLTGEGRPSRDYYRKVAELGIQAAEALDHAHQLGIVHRDIKPANLLLDGRGNVWVTDFGLAHVQNGEASLTGTGQMVGTPRYMSPEQALAKRVPIDHRTDVYSLGATLYELLTLRPAFESDDRQELLRRIAFEEPSKPRRLERGVPAELEIIVLKAMEKRPQDRYAAAQELADDLRRWLLDQPIRARRPSLRRRLGHWGRRHKPLVVSMLAALLMGLVGLAGGIGWAAHDRQTRRTIAANQFDDAMQLADAFLQKQKWPEANAAAKRAAGLLAGVEGDRARQQRFDQMEADLNMVGVLESLRLLAGNKTEMMLKGADFDSTHADAYRNYNLPVLELESDEAASRIAGSAIRAQLLAALLDWINASNDTAVQKRLGAILRAADGNSWERQVWDAWDRHDHTQLARLAQSEEILDQPPVLLDMLGVALSRNPNKAEAVKFLRRAQQRHPDDYWINHELARRLSELVPPGLEEAAGFFRAAIAANPQSHGAHFNFGTLFRSTGKPDEAIAEYREAIRVNPAFALGHLNLAAVLRDKGRLDEAIAEFREGIRIRKHLAQTHEANVFKKDLADAHTELGALFCDNKHDYDEAIVEFREAIRIKNDHPQAHFNFGIALSHKGQLAEAIAECRRAMLIKKDWPHAHLKLSNLLKDNGRLDEAIVEIQEAIHLNKNDASAHNDLGIVLAMKDRLDDAIAEFQEAIRLNEGYAEAHNNLGNVLSRKDRLDEAIEEYREAIRLKKDYANAHNNLKNALALRDLLAKLPEILSGRAKAANAAESLTLAVQCQKPYKKWYAASARLYSETFVTIPQLADNLNKQYRYNAACAAALAGCGQGQDANNLDANERARLRQQALDWLRADLIAYRQLLEKSGGKTGPAIAQRMQHWLKDDDFAGVRGDEALAKLPEEEQFAWRKLWADVAELLAKAQGKTPAERKPNTKERPRDHMGSYRVSPGTPSKSGSLLASLVKPWACIKATVKASLVRRPVCRLTAVAATTKLASTGKICTSEATMLATDASLFVSVCTMCGLFLRW